MRQENMCLKLIAKGVPPERVIELRNWADEQLASTLAGIEELRSRWGAGDRQIALYSGNIANKQGLEIVVEAARLLSHRPDILIVICGDGANRRNLEALAEGLPNVRFDALQPRERLGDMLSAASVHLLPQLANTADLVLPSKLTNMLASGRPVVATCVPGTSLHEELAGCGIAVQPGDAAAFATAIAALVDDAPRRSTLGTEALVRVAQRWRRDSVLDAFESALGAAALGQSERQSA
jgi:colanic acid biosynthesis glycosyl transferase WcaI